MTEIEQMTKDVFKWLHLGGCWHESSDEISNGGYRYVCKHCGLTLSWYDGNLPKDPEYISPAGRVRLLKEMMAREDWDKFIGSLKVGTEIPLCTDIYILPKIIHSFIYYAFNYITDETGLLLRAVYEFMRRV